MFISVCIIFQTHRKLDAGVVHMVIRPISAYNNFQCFMYTIYQVSPVSPFIWTSLSWPHGKSMMMIQTMLKTMIKTPLNHFSNHLNINQHFRTTKAISHCYDCQFESLNY